MNDKLKALQSIAQNICILEGKKSQVKFADAEEVVKILYKDFEEHCKKSTEENSLLVRICALAEDVKKQVQ